MSLKRLKSQRLRSRFSTAGTRARIRMRRNGVNDAPQGMAGGQWRSRWQTANRTASKFLMDLLTDMKRIDPRATETPSEASLTALSSDFADVMAASDLAKVSFSEGKIPSQELLDRARVDEDASTIIESIAGTPLMRMFTGSPDARKVADNTMKRLVRALTEMREPLMEYVEQQGAGFEEALTEEEELEDEVESGLGGGGIDIRGDIASGRFSVEEEEEEDEPRPTRRRKKDEPEEEFVPSEGTITVRKKRQAGAGRGQPQLSRQIGGFEQQIVKKRRNDLRPSAALLAAVAKDVLIFELDDGTAQVWPKGTITHTFGPTRGRSAAKTAVIYARGWREAEGAPKSRLKSRIVYSRYDDGDNFIVVEEGQTAAAPVADTRSLAERAAALKNNPFRFNPRSTMKWVRYHDDRAKGYVLDPEGEIYSLTMPGVGTVEVFKQERTDYMPAHWQVELFLDDPEADDRLALKGRSKFASTLAEAKRRANEMLTTRSNPDWRAMFGRAKQKGAEGAAAAQLAARRAAHEAKILAMKGRIAAERQRVKSSYRVLGLSLLEARDGRYKQEMEALDEVMGGEVGDSIYPNAFGAQRRHREGFFRLKDELAELERTRPNPKKGKKAKGLPHPSLSTVLQRGPRSAHVRLGTGHTGTRMPARPVRRNFLGSFFGPDKFVVVTYNEAGRLIKSIKVKSLTALSDALADLNVTIKGERALLADVERKGRADRSDDDLFSVWSQLAGMRRVVIEPVGV